MLVILVVDISQEKEKPETGLQPRRASHTWICTQPSGLASKPGILHSFALWVVLVWDVGHRAQWKESPAYLSVDSPPLTQKELPITAFNLLYVFDRNAFVYYGS